MHVCSLYSALPILILCVGIAYYRIELRCNLGTKRVDMANILGIDVGGTGIKAALVDTESGQLFTNRHRIDTPDPSTPENIDKAWRNTQIDAAFNHATGFPFVVLNDADAAGITEMRLGAGREKQVISAGTNGGRGSTTFCSGSAECSHPIISSSAAERVRTSRSTRT